MKHFGYWPLLAALLLGAFGPTPAFSADSNEIQDLKARIEALEKKQKESAPEEKSAAPWTDRISIGAHARVRHEGHYNYDRQAVIHDDDNFTLLRGRLNVDAKVPGVARVFLQPQASRVFGDSLLSAPLPFGPGNVPAGTTGNADDEDLSLHQGYADLIFGDTGFTLRAGRQEVKFGDERLVGALGWSNRSRSFDGADLIYDDDTLNAQLFFFRVNDTARATPPTVPQTHTKDPFFTGLHTTLKDVGSGLDLYALVFFDMDAGGNMSRLTLLPAPVMWAGDRDLFFGTFGLRTKDTPKDGLGYDLEAALQLGEDGPEKLFAFAGHAAIQYATDADFSPNVLLEYNIASGDDPDTKTDTAFRNLFPTNHNKYGYIDFMGWSNMHNLRIGLFASPIENANIEISGHQFWAYQPDGAAGAGTAAILATASSTVNRYRVGFGRELDVTVTYNYKKTAKLLLGYSLFLPGDLFKKEASVTPFNNDSAQFGYAQLQVDI